MSWVCDASLDLYVELSSRILGFLKCLERIFIISEDRDLFVSVWLSCISI